MAGRYQIQYLAHKDIDFTKWDNCIATADNGLIYGYSWYLDHMAEHWDGLVWNDYDAVMPVTWNRKFGIAYLYQPFLAAQLGVFGKHIDIDLLKCFLDAIPRKFRYWDIYLNHGNLYAIDGFNLYQRKNYVLDLDKPYESIYCSYRENIRRNIRKAEQLGCKPVMDFDVERLINLAIEQMRSFDRKAAANVERFRKLYHYLHERQQAITYGVLSNRDELIASCAMVFSHNRAYYLLVGNHPNGRTLGASHSLIDAFIRDHAQKKLLLDFEGSDIRNLAFFYSSFGAVEENYAAVKLNRLPSYIKWLKR